MIEKLNNQELDLFVSQQNYSQFLQSSRWLDFQKKLGNQVWKIGYLEKDQILGSAVVIEKKLPLNQTYLYLPRGPIINQEIKNKIKIVQLLLKGVRDISIQTKQNNEIFFRIEPIVNLNLKNIKKVKSIQPEQTLLLDLSKSEEELLAEMHQKTRYNIRLAEKKGVEVEKVEDYSKQFIYFENLIQKTAQRDKFTPHSVRYYRQMLESLGKNIQLWLAKYQDQVLGVNLVVNFGDTVTYLHGASSNQYRNLMAPHLLQWEQIKWAQQNNFKYYDFWGISEIDPQWAGFTRFKKGFGGQIKSLPGTFDLVYNQRIYKLYCFFKKFI